MQRHEIPTHLNVADRAFAGLTMHQLLSAAVGLALAYGAFSDLPLPLPLRFVALGCVLVVTAVLALWRPGGRAAVEWAFVLLRFWATPRVAVWRPRPPQPAAQPASREVVLPKRHTRAGEIRAERVGDADAT